MPREVGGTGLVVAAAALLLLAPGSALAHGGTYRPPPEDPPPRSDPPPSRTDPPPDQTKPPPTPTTPEPPPGTPTPPGGRGTPTPGSNPAPTPPAGPRTPTPEPKPRRGRGSSLGDWTAWWYYARDRWLDRSAARTDSGAGSFGAHAGTDGAPDAVAADAPERAWREAARAALRRGLDQQDVEVFTGCAVALGKAGDPTDSAPLLRALEKRYADVTIRESIALGLGLLGRDAPGARAALLGIVRDPRETARLRGMAAVALGVAGDPSAAPALLAAAGERGAHRDPAAGALVGLGLLAEPLVVPDLVAILDDESSTDAKALRPFAAYALGRTGGQEAVRGLGRALGDGDEPVRRAAVLALGECPPDQALLFAPVLARMAREDRDRPTRSFALVTLGRIGGPSAYDALVRIYSMGDRGERDFAALGLGILGRGLADAQSKGRIAAMLRGDFESREDADFRGALATALGLLGDAKAVPGMRSVLRDRGNPDLRAHCALALGLLGATEAAADLRAMATEKGEPVLQREAALALGLLGDPAAAPALADLLGKANSEYVRASAAQALGQIGGEDAARALASLLLDPAASNAARGQAAVGLGLMLDPRPVGGLAAISPGLDYLGAPPVILEVLSIP
jgi:HEAT repeat protein